MVLSHNGRTAYISTPGMVAVFMGDPSLPGHRPCMFRFRGAPRFAPFTHIRPAGRAPPLKSRESSTMTAQSVGGARLHRLLPLLALASLLAACGGGGGGEEPATHTITAEAGSGGSISPASATVDDGETASFIVTADSGYTIDAVSGCGGSLSGTSYTTGAVTGDCTVTASFAADPVAPATHTVSATAGTGGSISPASATVDDGEPASFTVTADSGYSIDAVSGCGGSLNGTTYTTGAVTADCTVTASFALTLPTLTIADASVLEGNSGTTSLTFTVTLSEQANGNVTVDYATSHGSATGGADCGTGVDYMTASDTLVVASGATSATFDVELCGDTVPEADETFTVALTNISANATLGTATATGTLTSDDAFGRLNDTGITACGDYAYGGSGTHNNNVDCAAAGATATVNGTETANGLDPVPAGQDAHYGRDTNPLTNDAADGKAGFSFTKLDASGAPLADQTAAYATTPWSCVLDNVTGLMWEVKTDDGGLHHKDWTYTWYNTDNAANGGSAGTAASGACGGTVAAGCDTEKLVAAVNTSTLCGYDDWRMPNHDELQSIADLGTYSPAIDTGLFPNTASTWYWSSSPYAWDSGSAWIDNFGLGGESWGLKSYASRVRLVRAGQ